MIGFSTTDHHQVVAVAVERHVGEQAGGEQVLQRLVDAVGSRTDRPAASCM